MKHQSIPRWLPGLVVGCLVALVGGDVVKAAEASVAVKRLLTASFRRVAGVETGGAAVFPDERSSWYGHSIGSPTVDFDGTTYRMWFVGMSPTDDAKIPYGFAERTIARMACRRSAESSSQAVITSASSSGPSAID